MMPMTTRHEEAHATKRSPLPGGLLFALLFAFLFALLAAAAAASPSNPVQVAYYANNTSMFQPQSVFVSGNYAYVASGNYSLTIFNVSNPSSPVQVAFVQNTTSLQSAASVFVSGGYAYVASLGTTTNGSLTVFNVSDPAHPVQIAYVTNDTSLNSPESVFVSGHYAYVTTFAGSSLTIFDVSDPSNPVQVAYYYANSPYSVFVSGGYAYVSNWGCSMDINDVSNPSNPVWDGNFYNASIACDLPSIFVSGGYAYLAAYANGGLLVLNVSNPSNPVEVAYVHDNTSMYLSTSVFVADGYAYITLGGNNSLSVFDVSTPSTPTQVASVQNATSLPWPNSVFVSGGYAYVASAGNPTHGSLTVFNVSSSYNASLLGPVTGSLLPVTPGQNVSINFSMTKDGSNLTSNVTVTNVTVCGLPCSSPQLAYTGSYWQVNCTSSSSCLGNASIYLQTNYTIAEVLTTDSFLASATATEAYAFHTYNFSLLGPVNGSLLPVTPGQNVSINFSYAKDGANLSSGVSVTNVTVCGLVCSSPQLAYTGSYWQVNCTTNASCMSDADLYLEANDTADDVLANASATNAYAFPAPFPAINFSAPTPANNTFSSNTSFVFNVSVNETGSPLSSFVWDWNGTNTTVYDGSLVLLLQLDNVSGLGENASSSTVADVSVSANDGGCQEENTPVRCNWTTGKTGSALSFNGVNDSVSVPDSAGLDLTRNFTVEAWFKPSSMFNASSSNYEGLLDKGAYSLFLDPSDGKLKFDMDSDAAKSWSAVGSGMNNVVDAFATYDGQLYAGGSFTTAGGVSANRTAVWNGTSWSALGTGMNSTVYTLAAYDGKLYAGGIFGTADGNTASYVASWNGTDWNAVGSGMNNTVEALVVYDGQLYAGGTFTTAGGVTANRIASWNGTSWNTLGSGTGMNGAVDALAVYNGQLVAGGAFTRADGKIANRVAAWNGTSWNTLGSGTGMNNVIYTLAVYDDKLYAGGAFITADGNTTRYVASWNGTAWNAVGSGMGAAVYALAVYDGQLYAGGAFTNTSDGTLANRTAIWDGTNWQPLDAGTGMSGAVYSFIAYEGALYAGGGFTKADGTTANRIASWSSGQEEELDSTTASWDAGWHHAAATYDGSNLSLYIDGALQSSVATSATLPTNTLPLLIGTTYGSRIGGGNTGGGGSGEERFSGAIDDVRIYNRSLNSSEVAFQYNYTMQKIDASAWQFLMNESGLATGTYTYSAAAASGGAWNATGTRTLTVSTVPNVTTARISPTPLAPSNDTLLGYCNATDGSGHTLTYEYQWWLDGALNASGTTTSSPQGVEVNVANVTGGLAAGQNWTLSCQANNSFFSSAWLNSSQTAIVPPLSLSLLGPVTGSLLPAVPGQNVSINFSYAKDGANLTGGVAVTNVTVGGLPCSSPQLAYTGSYWQVNCTTSASCVGNASLYLEANYTTDGALADATATEAYAFPPPPPPLKLILGGGALTFAGNRLIFTG